MVIGDAGYCACGCGCLRGLRHANLQGSKEEPQQKTAAVIGAAAFAGAVLAVIVISRTPMPL